jgi:hypothetical protein
MKKMIMILLALVTWGCVVSFGGTKGPESHMAVVKTGEIIKVIYESPVSSQVKVTISDADGNEVFAEKVESAEGFIRPYNFSLLPKGDYTISLADKNGEYSENICTRDKEWVANVIKLGAREEKYMVSIPYQGPGEVAIQVYDQHEQLVYSETVVMQTDFAKIYNLKNLDEGATVHVVNQSSGEMRNSKH